MITPRGVTPITRNGRVVGHMLTESASFGTGPRRLILTPVWSDPAAEAEYRQMKRGAA